MSLENLELDGRGPIYLQIVRFARRGVVAGTIQDGEEMPSRRVLSALLGVNPNTVQKAYRLLEEEGLIRSHTGAKSCVSAPPERAEALRRELPAWTASAFVGRMKAMGLTRQETVELVTAAWEEETE